MFWKIWEMKQMYDKYKKLQDEVKKVVIRASAGPFTYTAANWDQKTGSVVIDISWEMKVQNIDIKDDSLLSPNQKATLESYLKEAFDKAQSKAQQVAMEKTKDVLGFDPNEMLGSLWAWWMPKIPWLS